jgi:hypothetical protein
MTPAEAELFRKGREDAVAGRKDAALFSDYEGGRVYREGHREGRRDAEMERIKMWEENDQRLRELPPPDAPPRLDNGQPIPADVTLKLAPFAPAAVEEPIPFLKAPDAPPAAATPPPPAPELEPKPPAVDDPSQLALFETEPDWRAVWTGMPDFVQNDLEPWASLTVHFANRADRNAFSKLIAQTITDDTRSLWIPRAEITRYVDKRFVTERPVNPRHPIYIVSKGRYETRLTSDSLDKIGIPHFIVVEEKERELYQARVGRSATILVLDPAYQERYDPCDDLGMTKSKGPGPARNFAWEHSLRAGATWHWVMDDNIDGFYRLHNNIKTPAATGAIFRAMEDFVERYENVGMAGPNYFMFASRKSGAIQPYTLNTRIYSCNLIRNDLPNRWRARYNEDTDLSLQILLNGLCTVLFNAFLQYKVTTQTLSGGCTTEFYAKEGTRPKSEMIAKLYPDLARVTERFGRVHHYVNYSVFSRNVLKLRAGVKIPAEPDNYGMTLEMLDGSRPAPIYAAAAVPDGEDEEAPSTEAAPPDENPIRPWKTAETPDEPPAEDCPF